MRFKNFQNFFYLNRDMEKIRNLNKFGMKYGIVERKKYSQSNGTVCYHSELRNPNKQFFF